MLLRLRVQNFRSICQEQELSLVATNLASDQTGALREFKSFSTTVLPIATIYGANASGKTTVLKALSFLQNAVENSQSKWAPGQSVSPPAFAFEDLGYPTRIEIDFELEGHLYTFGFSADRHKFIDEWLFNYPNKKRQVLYKRSEDRTFTYGRNFTGNKKVIESIVRENSLFISAAAQSNHELGARIYDWISSWLFIAESRDIDRVASATLFKDPETCELLVKYLKAADLGIVGIKQEEAPKEVAQMMSNMLSTLPNEIRESYEESHGSQFGRLQMIHQGKEGREIPFYSGDESNGTLAYLYLLPPIIVALTRGTVVCIDELDESLHPALVKKLVELFRSLSTNSNGAQLIFNTHDTNLLSLDLLRRDEIWFTERDQNGATHLYPLTDFKPRNTESVAKGYLQGKYGAIPFLGDFDQLLRGEEGESEAIPA